MQLLGTWTEEHQQDISKVRDDYENDEKELKQCDSLY